MCSSDLDRLLQNDKLYNHLKGDWTHEGWNKSKNIKVTTGRESGKLYVTREQMNVEYIMEECKAYREKAEAGFMDPLAPLMPDGKLGYKWIGILSRYQQCKVLHWSCYSKFSNNN